MVVLRWSCCDGRAAMVVLQWSYCDGRTAMVVLRWSYCDGRTAMVVLRWSCCDAWRPTQTPWMISRDTPTPQKSPQSPQALTKHPHRHKHKHISTMKFDLDAWLKFEEENLLANYFEARKEIGRKVSVRITTKDNFLMCDKKQIFHWILEHEVAYRESNPGPGEEVGWNESWATTIAGPHNAGTLVGAQLRNAILEYFRAIPECPISPLFCYLTLELFKQHKKTIMGKLDPPIQCTDILTQEAQEIYNEQVLANQAEDNFRTGLSNRS